MKKYISMFMVALAATFTFVSCDTETDEKAGGTAVEKMAGLWDVTVDVVDEQGNVLGKDPLGLGTININTYNTAAKDAKGKTIKLDEADMGAVLVSGIDRTFYK